MTATHLEPASLTLRLLGPFEARVQGAALPPLRTRKDAWLLALLALHEGRPLDRAWLAGLLWCRSDESAAFANLRKSLKSLRRALGSEASRLLAPTPRSLALDLAAADVDLLAFDAAVARSDTASLETAVTFYRGPLLDGCVEAWVLPERARREEAYLGTLERLADRAGQARKWSTAEGYLRRAVAVNPLRESAQRALMHALARGGNYAAALHTYRELRLRLYRELHAEPDPETTALFDAIRDEASRKAGRECRGAARGK